MARRNSSLSVGAFFYTNLGFRISKLEVEERIIALNNSVAPVETVSLETVAGVIFHPQFEKFLEVPDFDIDSLREMGFLRFSSENEFSISTKGLAYHKKMQRKPHQSLCKQPKEFSMINHRGPQLGEIEQFRVFISHSSADKPFVHRLAEDLRTQSLNVWVDEQELRVGDSIVQGISSGLKDADYLVVVLSPASVQSQWVQAELNSALMDQLSGQGVAVLPVIIEDCEIPVLLRDRVYADFRREYDKGLQVLLRVFKQEKAPVAPALVQPESQDCSAHLAQLKQADLRRLITKRLSLADVRTLWFDTLNSRIEDEMPQRSLQECVIDLLIRTEQQGLMADLIRNLCEEHPNIANPR